MGEPQDQEQPTTQPTVNPPRRRNLGKDSIALTSPLRPASARLAKISGRKQDGARRIASLPSPVSQAPQAAAFEQKDALVSITKPESQPVDLEPPELQELVWRLCLENETMRAELDEGREQSKKLQAERDHAQQEADRLREQLALNQQRIAAIEESNKTLFAEHELMWNQARGLQAELDGARKESRGSDEQLREARRMLNDTDAQLNAACSRRDTIASQLVEAERLLRCEQLENQLMMRAAIEEGIRRRVRSTTEAQERVPVVTTRRRANKVKNPFRRRRALGKVMPVDLGEGKP
mmetsp:Transcript_88222/g.175250  ORF Transcript_88222/g.175250 Transcript_88222/m.175250 type:complete len:295 (-) Transcript_88222:29-913(-)|eukprot:CAMPEP_0172803960 /NCGR_PEP_ID=MMETSP1075-20121228/4847_1 /TAXON_ID=2916 /ORGANISM="Ceratium fusus, Strain PA161109" /LENGTH=294 /DNA_ID=CAMNT_0013642465 /DNA_START=53 /DNA_END=937 /DNA_ORIENTATION=+